jgi:hypothetical protein
LSMDSLPTNPLGSISNYFNELNKHKHFREIVLDFFLGSFVGRRDCDLFSLTKTLFIWTWTNLVSLEENLIYTEGTLNSPRTILF